MHMNKAIAIPEPERHRSEYPNWNFEAELFAFGRRLGEEFDEPTLRRGSVTWETRRIVGGKEGKKGKKERREGRKAGGNEGKAGDEEGTE